MSADGIRCVACGKAVVASREEKVRCADCAIEEQRLMDQFAAHALIGLLFDEAGQTINDQVESVAQTAYCVARAMVIERRRWRPSKTELLPA